MRLGWLAMAIVLAWTGCSGGTTRRPPIQVFPDMDRQPKYKVQSESRWFADGRADRLPVPGTIPQEAAGSEDSFATGVSGGMYVGLNPLPYTRETLLRGQERFNIYCAPCHDRVGTGRGMVSQRSMWLPTNLHDARVREMPDGEIFYVITNGRRTMPAYRYQIPPEDRWAIVAYVRALQRARLGRLEDVPADLRGELQ